MTCDQGYSRDVWNLGEQIIDNKMSSINKPYPHVTSPTPVTVSTLSMASHLQQVQLHMPNPLYCDEWLLLLLAFNPISPLRAHTHAHSLRGDAFPKVPPAAHICLYFSMCHIESCVCLLH